MAAGCTSSYGERLHYSLQRSNKNTGQKNKVVVNVEGLDERARLDASYYCARSVICMAERGCVLFNYEPRS